MKKLITTAIILFALAVQPQTRAEQHQQHTPAIGIHGMAIFKVQDRFYASHMPLANSIHAHQVIFSFNLGESESAQLDVMFSQFELVSLMPTTFDLWDLMNGSITQIDANIHANHFERGGELMMENVKLEVVEMLLAEPLSEANNGQFYLLPLLSSDKDSDKSSDKGLLVHKIGSNPSFDQILEIELATADSSAQSNANKPQLVKLTEGESLAVSQGLPEGVQFSIARQLYLETRDFQ